MFLLKLSNSDLCAKIESSKGYLTLGIYWFLKEDSTCDHRMVVGKVDGKIFSLARYLFGDPGPGKVWDHENGDFLDFSPENIRPATFSQSSINRKKRKYCTSKYNGVSWRKDRQYWRFSVSHNGIAHREGGFSNEEDAARARDKVAKRIQGEFARLNFPDEI